MAGEIPFFLHLSRFTIKIFTLAQSTPHQLKLVDLRKPHFRVLLIVPVALALLFSWFATRWYMGNFVAEFAPNLEEGQLETALAAMRLAPDDPWGHWVVAGLKKRTLLEEDLADAVRHYEEAVRLSPNDYRFWVDLGRAREDSGDRPAGEKALRRAVELAPSYALPRWYLGNLLLRAGRGEEAFIELRRAAGADAAFRQQLFNIAWNLYGQNIEAIKQVVGESPGERAAFANYLIGRQRLDDALSLWSSLSLGEKRAHPATGDLIMRTLLGERRYRAALGIIGDIDHGFDPTEATQILNGGFEEDIQTSGGNPFTWQIKSDPQAQIAIDESSRRSGARSLRIAFRSPSMITFNNVAQLVVVEPSEQYRFECYVRADALKSGGTPVIEIIDAMDGTTVLGTSPPIASGTYDWRQITIDFKTSPRTEAVTVRIGRAMCGTAATCPIFGMIWYDDFSLKRLGGATSPRNKPGDSKAGA